MIRPPLHSTLFPYTTLFRSSVHCRRETVFLLINFRRQSNHSVRARQSPAQSVWDLRSEEHTSELQSRGHLVCRLLLEKKKCQNSDEEIKISNHGINTHRHDT